MAHHALLAAPMIDSQSRARVHRRAEHARGQLAYEEARAARARARRDPSHTLARTCCSARWRSHAQTREQLEAFEHAAVMRARSHARLLARAAIVGTLALRPRGRTLVTLLREALSTVPATRRAARRRPRGAPRRALTPRVPTAARPRAHASYARTRPMRTRIDVCVARLRDAGFSAPPSDASTAARPTARALSTERSSCARVALVPSPSSEARSRTQPVAAQSQSLCALSSSRATLQLHARLDARHIEGVHHCAPHRAARRLLVAHTQRARCIAMHRFYVALLAAPHALAASEPARSPPRRHVGERKCRHVARAARAREVARSRRAHRFIATLPLRAPAASSPYCHAARACARARATRLYELLAPCAIVLVVAVLHARPSCARRSRAARSSPPPRPHALHSALERPRDASARARGLRALRARRALVERLAIRAGARARPRRDLASALGMRSRTRARALPMRHARPQAHTARAFARARAGRVHVRKEARVTLSAPSRTVHLRTCAHHIARLVEREARAARHTARRHIRTQPPSRSHARADYARRAMRTARMETCASRSRGERFSTRARERRARRLTCSSASSRGARLAPPRAPLVRRARAHHRAARVREPSPYRRTARARRHL